jgi:hypothetical protein
MVQIAKSLSRIDQLYRKNPYIMNSEMWSNGLVNALYLSHYSNLISRLVTSHHFRWRSQSNLHQSGCVISNNILEVILLKFENMIQNVIISILLFRFGLSEPLLYLRTCPFTFMYIRLNERNVGQ